MENDHTYVIVLLILLCVVLLISDTYNAYVYSKHKMETIVEPALYIKVHSGNMLWREGDSLNSVYVKGFDPENAQVCSFFPNSNDSIRSVSIKQDTLTFRRANEKIQEKMIWVAVNLKSK